MELVQEAEAVVGWWRPLESAAQHGYERIEAFAFFNKAIWQEMWCPHNPLFFPVTVGSDQHCSWLSLLSVCPGLTPPRAPGCQRFLTWPFK